MTPESEEVGAGGAHAGLQFSDTSMAAVNVLDCWSPEINAVISSLRSRVIVRICNFC